MTADLARLHNLWNMRLFSRQMLNVFGAIPAILSRAFSAGVRLRSFTLEARTLQRLYSVSKRPFWSRMNCCVTRLRWAGSRSQINRMSPSM